MLALDVRGDIKEIERHLKASERRHIPFATRLALTRTAQAVAKEESAEIARVFDRPKPFTLRALFIRPATKSDLSAEVKIKDQSVGGVPAMKYLRAQIFGGPRKRKAYEELLIRAGAMPPGMLTVPGRGAQLDQYGNIKPAQISQMLSDLSARRDPLNNATQRSRQRRLRSRTKRATFYFSTYPQTKSTAHLRDGIYKRTHLGFGAAISPVLIFVKRTRYKKRFDFYRIADQVGRMRWPREFARAMSDALRTAR